MEEMKTGHEVEVFHNGELIMTAESVTTPSIEKEPKEPIHYDLTDEELKSRYFWF